VNVALLTANAGVVQVTLLLGLMADMVQLQPAGAASETNWERLTSSLLIVVVGLGVARAG
jgi:hypothetical protein